MFGAGRSLFISKNKALEDFKTETNNPNATIRNLCQLAYNDAGLLAKLTESANATRKFRSARRKITPLDAVNRLGINGCRSVIYNYIFEQSNINLSKPWLRAFHQINNFSGEVLSQCFQIAEEYKDPKIAYEAFQVSLLFSLSCQAKIVAASNIKLPVTKESNDYASNPDLVLAEMFAIQIGIEENTIFTTSETEAYTACSIAQKAWERINKRVIDNDVLSYKFKPRRFGPNL